MLRPVVCPNCGGPKWPQYKLCRKCHNEERNGNRWPHYRGTHPMKQCPDCDTWIQRKSQTCSVCALKRQRQAKCVHYWIIDEFTNFGVCVKCEAGKQFPTLMEQIEQMDRMRSRNRTHGRVLIEV